MAYIDHIASVKFAALQREPGLSPFIANSTSENKKKFVSIFPTILGAVEWLSPELVLDLVVSTPQIWIATAAGAYDFLQK